MKPTLTEHCDILTPFEVRMLARQRGRRLTTAEIARKSKLSINTVNLLSNRKSFAGVRIGTAQRFCEACGHDLLRPRRNIQYITRVMRTGRGLAHLNSAQKKRFLKYLSSL